MNAALRSARLALRPVRDDDLDALHALFVAPAMRRHLWDDEVIPRERAIELIAASLDAMARDGTGLWLASDRAARLIGFGMLWRFHAPPQLELGFGVADDCVGRGYATEIGRAVLEYAANALRLPTLRASTDGANRASQRVLDKLGFLRIAPADVAPARPGTLFYERALAPRRLVRLDVFGRRMDALHDGRWQLFEVGGDGKRRPSEWVIPDFVAPDEIEQYLFDLLHESAHPRHPRIVRLPDEP